MRKPGLILLLILRGSLNELATRDEFFLRSFDTAYPIKLRHIQSLFPIQDTWLFLEQ